MENILIIGAGGLASVVLDSIHKEVNFNVLGFCVDNLPIGTSIVKKYKIISNTSFDHIGANKEIHFIIAVGNNKSRELLFNNACEKFTPATIIDPTSIISSNTSIGEGSILLANTIINANTNIGKNCLIGAGSVIDHNCEINNHSHISIGTILGSYSTINAYYTTEIGQRINSKSILK